MRRHKHLNATCLCALVMAASPTVADPFDWGQADVFASEVTFADGQSVRYRTGHIYFGGAIGVYVVIDNDPIGPSETDQVLIDGMSVGVPVIHTWQGLFVVEETGDVWGADGPSSWLRCWRPKVEFVEVDCPADMSISEKP